MTTITTYTSREAEHLIRSKKAEGEYHVTGWLDLRGCDLSGVTLPTSVTGSLYLSGCDLSGVTLPASVGGWLDLSGCDLSGVTLPASVGGWLDLSGCDLSGVTLPASVGGSLDLRGCRNPDPSQWWTEHGEATRRRCLAVCPDDGYALVQTDTDHFSAGCRKKLTREQALAHWNRSDARAKLFTAAIEASSARITGDKDRENPVEGAPTNRWLAIEVKRLRNVLRYITELAYVDHQSGNQNYEYLQGIADSALRINAHTEHPHD